MNTFKPNNIFTGGEKSSNLIYKTTFSLLVMVGLFTVAKNTHHWMTNIHNIFTPRVTAPAVNSPHLIIQQMKSVSELTTRVFVMDTIVPTSSARKLGKLTLGKTKLLYIARGEVKAGLDLSKMTSEQIKIDGQNITITLPPAEILDRKVNVDQSQVYDYDRGFFNLGPDVAPQLQTKAQNYTLQKITKTACEQDILDEANDKAVSLVHQLMLNLGYRQVTIIPTKNNHCFS